MQIVLQNTGDYAVSFKYKPVLVNFMRQIPGAEFKAASKSWLVPAASVNDLKLAANQIQNFEKIAWIDGRVKASEVDKFYIPPMPELTIPHGLKFDPKPYQGQGIARGLELKRFMNADDPGLGKTFQTIGTLNLAEILWQSAFPCLVTCPGSVKYHWQREWEKFTDRRALVLTDDLLDNWPYYAKNGLYDVFIVNYESLQKYFVRAITTPRGKPMLFQHIIFKPTIDLFKSVVVDESQRCSDFGTQQTKFMIGIANGIAYTKEWKITLSGTPIINNHKGLKPQLQIMDRLNDFGGPRYFDQHYCAGPNKSSNGRELRARLWQTCFFRRTKAEVKGDLPQLERQIITCDITNRNEYNLAQADLITYLRKYKSEGDSKRQKSMRGIAFQKINILAQIAAKGKIKAITEHIKDFNSSGKKLVVYCELHFIVDALLHKFPKAVCITGRQDGIQKQRAIDAFSDDERVKLCIISKAAGTGTDGLQKQCSEIDLIEYPWHDAGCSQIESRVDRPGNINGEPVTARYWQAMDTVDEKKWNIIQIKKKISGTVMSTSEVEEVEENIVDMVADMFDVEV